MQWKTQGHRKVDTTTFIKSTLVISRFSVSKLGKKLFWDFGIIWSICIGFLGVFLRLVMDKRVENEVRAKRIFSLHKLREWREIFEWSHYVLLCVLCEVRNMCILYWGWRFGSDAKRCMCIGKWWQYLLLGNSLECWISGVKICYWKILWNSNSFH